MKNRIFQLTVLCVALTVALATPCRAQDSQDNESAEHKEMKRSYKIADLLIVRPIGLVLTAAGATVWAATLPFTMISGDSKEASDVLMGEPAKMAFGKR